MKRNMFWSVVCVAMIVLLSSVPAFSGTTERVSVSSSGEQANAASWSYRDFKISDDGRYAMFVADASNLVAGDTNGVQDTFVRDRIAGTTEMVSLNSSGEPGNGYSNFATMSADGRYVAFHSYATNLVSNDTNGTADVFIRDRQTGTTERLMNSSGQQLNQGAFTPYISGDGRYIAFTSSSTNLVSEGIPSGTHGLFYVYDRTNGTFQRYTFSCSIQLNFFSYDGRYVTFTGSGDYYNGCMPGDTNGLSDQFIYDLTTDTLEVLSVSSAGTWGNDLSNYTYGISRDGRYVVFQSLASNLAPDDINGVYDVFVRDRTAGTTQAVSVSTSGAYGNNHSHIGASISSDGRYVAFASWSTNLVPSDTNNQGDVFVRDLVTGITERVSLSSNGGQVYGGESSSPGITGDGRYLLFRSGATTVVSGDTNGVTDIFVRDRQSSSFAVTDACYNYVADTLNVTAETGYGSSDYLTLQGYGAMTWNGSAWEITAEDVTAAPQALTICSFEGCSTIN